MSETLDTTKMKCPEGCLIPSGFADSPRTAREFRWYDGTTGTRNYCSQCGEELVEAE